jgi:Flp pilus assembly protein TadD
MRGALWALVAPLAQAEHYDAASMPGLVESLKAGAHKQHLQSVMADPGNAAAYFSAAEAMKPASQEHANAFYWHSLTLDPSHGSAAEAKSALLAHAKTLAEYPKTLEAAVGVCSQLAELDPSDAATHLTESTILQAHGQWGAASEAALRALQLMPNDVTTMINHIGILIKQNQLEDAIRWLRKAVELSPENPNLKPTAVHLQHTVSLNRQLAMASGPAAAQFQRTPSERTAAPDFGICQYLSASPAGVHPVAFPCRAARFGAKVMQEGRLPLAVVADGLACDEDAIACVGGIGGGGGCKGSAVLVFRGGCSFYAKSTALLRAGAAAVLVADSDASAGGEEPMKLVRGQKAVDAVETASPNAAVLSLLNEDGLALQKLLESPGGGDAPGGDITVGITFDRKRKQRVQCLDCSACILKTEGAPAKAVADAVKCLGVCGFAVMPGLFDKAMLDAFRTDYHRWEASSGLKYGDAAPGTHILDFTARSPSIRGKFRSEHLVPLTAPVNGTSVVTNLNLSTVVHAWMDSIGVDETVLDTVSVIQSMPGSDDQVWCCVRVCR